MYFCYSYSQYRNVTRHHLISKHNIVNFFDVDILAQIDVIFSLKNNKRECNLILFWLIFTLSGRKPLILKSSGFKTNKLKFILQLNPKDFIGLLRVFSIFILSGHEKKKKMVLKKEQSCYFFIFKGSYLEYLDTFCFYNYISNQDLKFLLENLYLVFKFKGEDSRRLATVLSCLQLPTTDDTKRDDFAGQG
jgi:hypothetical protein